MFEREKNFKQEPPFVTENIASSDIILLHSVIVNRLRYLPGMMNSLTGEGMWMLDDGQRA